MNIFVLGDDPKEYVRYYVNSHVIKMPLEYSQLLSTAVREWDGRLVEIKNAKNKIQRFKLLPGEFVQYNPEKDRFFVVGNIIPLSTHTNHPCSIWTRHSIENFNKLKHLAKCLGDEYTYRYGKVHKSTTILHYIPDPVNFPENPESAFPCAMPEEYITDNVVESYRRYYALGKKHIHFWKKRSKPYWIDCY